MATKVGTRRTLTSKGKKTGTSVKVSKTVTKYYDKNGKLKETRIKHK